MRVYHKRYTFPCNVDNLVPYLALLKNNFNNIVSLPELISILRSNL
jgi:hypothetical protein